MEKATKIKIAKGFGWGVLAIVLLFALTIAIASPVVKHLINTKGPEWIGRDMHVDYVLINPFTGGVTLKGFTCKEADGETNFIAFDKLYVRVAYPQLMAKRVKVRTIQLEGFEGQVLKYDSTLNITDIINRFTEKEEPADSTAVAEESGEEGGSSWDIILDDIRISNSALRYQDTVTGKEWCMKDISLHIPGLYFDNQRTKAGLEFGLASGGKVGLQAGYRMESSRCDVQLDMQDVHSDVIMPLIEDYLGEKEVSAMMNGNVQMRGRMDDLESLHFGGDLNLSDVHLTDNSGPNVWKYDMKTIHVSGGNISDDGITRVMLDATSASDGTAVGSFIGDPDMSKRDTYIELKIRNVQIAEFDALCRNYTGYPIENGVLLLDSKIDVINGQMEGNNRIEIDHPRIGRKEKGTKAPYKNIPVRLGIKTLTSVQGMLLVDVPIKGDVNNPQFKFRKVIGRALAKVFFGPLMGLKDRDKSITTAELREMNEMLAEDSVLFRKDPVREVPADIAVPASDSIVLPKVSE